MKMSAFSECLTRIKKNRNLTSTKVAELCGVDVTVVFRWGNGERLPEKWDKIDLLVAGLHLSNEERTGLEAAYAKTLFGEGDYQIYISVLEILYTLQRLRSGKEKKKEISSKGIQEMKLPEFIELKNKSDVMEYMKELLNYPVFKDKLCLKFDTVNPEVSTMLKLFLNGDSNCEIEEIVHLDEEDGFYQHRNIQILGEMVEMIFQRNKVTIYIAGEGEIETGNEKNWILTDDFFMEFNATLTKGIVTTNKEWIRLSMENFKRLKKYYHTTGRAGINRMDSVSLPLTGGSKIRCIEFQPSITLGLTGEILDSVLYQDIPGRDKIVSDYANRSRAVSYVESVFTKEGLQHFMDTGVIEEYPYDMYKALDLETRCQVLHHILESVKEGRVTLRMIKEAFFPDMEGVRIEQIYDEDKSILGIELHFMDISTNEDGETVHDGSKERFEVTDERITGLFSSFWKCVENERYTYSAEETAEYMEKVLKEYEKRI